MSDAVVKALVELGQSVSLTKRQAELLAIMRDEDEYLVISGSDVWVGFQRTSVAMAYMMLRFMWIGSSSGEFQHKDYLIYTINERGLAALKKHEEQNI